MTLERRGLARQSHGGRGDGRRSIRHHLSLFDRGRCSTGRNARSLRLCDCRRGRGSGRVGSRIGCTHAPPAARIAARRIHRTRRPPVALLAKARALVRAPSVTRAAVGARDSAVVAAIACLAFATAIVAEAVPRACGWARRRNRLGDRTRRTARPVVTRAKARVALEPPRPPPRPSAQI